MNNKIIIAGVLWNAIFFLLLLSLFHDYKIYEYE